jgi:hypothetical protein
MVQATVNEPLELLVSFVAHHLDLGADLVHLYLDQPHPEAVAAFQGHPKVRLTECDAAYWARVNPRGRPPGLPGRQQANYRHVYDRMEHDWVLFCDADEYLAPAEEVAALLARQPARLDFLRIKVAEKVLPPGLHPATVFEGTFRTTQPAGADYALEIYGPDLAPMLERVVAAHDVGKSIVRRGVHCTLRTHMPVPVQPASGQPDSEARLEWAWMPNTWLAHYDALTPLYYLVKLLARHLVNKAIIDSGRRTGQRHRSREEQMAFAVAACAHANPVEVTEVLHRLTPASMAALRKRGLLVDLALAPDLTAREHFPDLAMDFTPEAFDRALRVKHAATLTTMGVA